LGILFVRPTQASKPIWGRMVTSVCTNGTAHFNFA
jgi:hypothetical protein